jgi:enoyl-CoA hydratase/carnithine racemase
VVRIERHDRVVVFTLQGASDLNVGVMDAEFYAAITDYQNDPDLWCAVITGAGEKAFSAGADIKKAAASGFSFNFWLDREKTFLTGQAFWKPLIAAVNGYAIGAGMMLALGCDIRIASENATFGLPEIKYGFPPALGATQRLPREIALGPALEMLLTGDAISAAQAERWGLVNRVVPLAELLPAAIDLAQRIAANAPRGVQATKELAWRSLDMTLEEGLRFEDAITQLARDTEDAREGPRAYAEKRTPNFQNR